MSALIFAPIGTKHTLLNGFPRAMHMCTMVPLVGGTSSRKAGSPYGTRGCALVTTLGWETAKVTILSRHPSL
eukprot:2833790-Amphidinium_carterae.1